MLYVLLCQGCDGYCVFCLYCEAWSCRCSCMGSVSVSSCSWNNTSCCMFVSNVHLATVLNAVFCMPWSLLMVVEDERDDHTVPNDTAYKQWNCHSGYKLLCKLCRTFPPPAKWARFTVFGQASHADPLDGWRSSSQKRVMSRLIQVRQHQTNESGFAISAINKYMSGSRYP